MSMYEILHKKYNMRVKSWNNQKHVKKGKKKIFLKTDTLDHTSEYVSLMARKWTILLL